MFRAISSYIKRREYRRRVDSEIRWILVGFSAEAVGRLLKAYPGRLSAADDGFDAGDNAAEVAVRTAASILTDLIEKVLPHDQKQLLHEHLLARLGLTDGDQATNAAAAAWVESFLVAESQIFAMAQSGHVHPDWRRIFVSEIVGALAGTDAAERSVGRIMGGLV